MQNETTVGARWIVPVDQPPLREASLSVCGGRITAIKGGGQLAADRDLGDVVLIPGLVNAHTHLEFSSLSQPLGQPGLPITDWIPLVIADRRQRKEADLRTAIESGVGEATRTGTVALGEIATHPWFNQARFSEARFLCFVERLGTHPAENHQILEQATDWLAASQGTWCGRGLSPHAPYSLNEALFSELIRLSAAEGCPVAMHLAESPEEIEWLAEGGGPFRDLLDRLGAAASRPAARRPLDYLRVLASAAHALVVHGNYLADDELDFLAGRKNLHVVYCPRTHAFFGHRRYPLQKLIDREINVAVGTDSRASNPDLNLLSELQHVRASFPDLSLHQVLEMGTINGARALQMERECGSLTVGKRARFVTIPLRHPDDDPLEAVFAWGSIKTV